MEPVSPPPSSSISRSIHREERTEQITSVEDAKRLLLAHIEQESQEFLEPFLSLGTIQWEEGPILDQFYYILCGAMELLNKEIERGSQLEIICNAIYARYQTDKLTLDQIWGDEKVAELPKATASTKAVTFSLPPSRGREIDQRKINLREMTYAELHDLCFSKPTRFSYDSVGLGRHEARIIEIMDAKLVGGQVIDVEIGRDDFELLKEVFTRLNEAKTNTFEGCVFNKIQDVWLHIYLSDSLPFNYQQSREINGCLGPYKIRNFSEKFSMLQLERESLASEGLKDPTLELVIALYNGKANRWDKGAEEAITAFNQAFVSVDLASAFGKIKDRLNGLPMESTKTPGPGKPERSWGQIAMMAAAGILTLYVGNRFVVQPALQWYRTRGTRV